MQTDRSVQQATIDLSMYYRDPSGRPLLAGRRRMQPLPEPIAPTPLIFEQSLARALAAQAAGRFAEEIAPVTEQVFEGKGLKPRRLALPRKVTEVSADSHVRPTPIEALAKLKPVFGGVQTGGNSSAIVDGAAAVVMVGEDRAADLETLAARPDVLSLTLEQAVRELLPVRVITAEEADQLSYGRFLDPVGLDGLYAVLLDDGTLELRSERDGKGDGRVYHVAFTASDAFGASCSGEATVCVPHDQGHAGCGDGGAQYPSGVP